MRPPSRISRNWRNPSPRSSSASQGTVQSRSDSSRVSEARQPSFSSGNDTSRPGVPAGTIRFEISGSPSCSPVTAVIVTHAVMSVPALVMNILEPLTTQLPSCSSARERVAPASEPASGSVRPKAASRLPDARSRASGVAARRCRRRIGIIPRGVSGDRDRHRRVDTGEAPRPRARTTGCRDPRRRGPRGSGCP